MKRTISTVIIGAALTATALAPTAGAHTVKYDTTATIKFKKGGKDAGTFSGGVDSVKPRCEANRTVNVLVRGTESDATIGTDGTDALGDWTLTSMTDVTPGTYYAVVAKKVLRKTSKHRHVCKRVQTADLTVK